MRRSYYRNTFGGRTTIYPVVLLVFTAEGMLADPLHVVVVLGRIAENDTSE
jgi:hypothetical protein